MVFEHMAHGDLHEFLISHSPKSDCSIDSDMDMRVLTQSEMAYIAIQIAAGMEDLSSHMRRPWKVFSMQRSNTRPL